MEPALLEGFATSAALIIAIGAQNAFVLRCGLRREHVLTVVLVCAFSDALLITLGVAGLGTLVQRSPTLLLMAVASTMLTVPVVSPKLARMKEIVLRAK